MISSRRDDKIDCDKKSLNTDNDTSIIATANDAIIAKLAASSMKCYRYHDPYLPCIAKSKGTKMRNPLIRKGTYARVCVMDRSISAFLSLESQKKQVVVLGAGMDSSFLRYRSDLLQFSVHKAEGVSSETQDVRWYEIDHVSVIENKRTLYRRQNWPSPYLVGHDLRENPKLLLQTLHDHHSFQFELPTLLVMECVLMYLPATSSRNLLSTFVDQCSSIFCSLYDPIVLHDTYGEMMLRNLKNLCGSHMLYQRTLSQQLKNLLNCGFQIALGCDMLDAYNTVLTDLQRNSGEMLDEIEEWTIIMKHYCFIVGGNSKSHPRLVEKFCSVGNISLMGFQESTSNLLKKND